MRMQRTSRPQECSRRKSKANAHQSLGTPPGVSGSMIYRCPSESEVGLDGKGELANENLLESGDVVLFIEDKHSFLVIREINRTKGYGTILIRNQDSAAGDASYALVAVGEYLDV